MPRWRAIGNVADSLAGSFVSRNNDLDGYWVLGQLKSWAERKGSPILKLQLKGGPQGNNGEEHQSVLALSVHYSCMLDRLVSAAGLPPDSVTEASIQVSFAHDDPEWPTIPLSTWGRPVRCEVSILDHHGRSFVRRRYTCCGAHDPSRERRRAT